MTEPHTSLSYDPNRLLDTMSAWFGVTSDRMLSRILRLSPLVIHSIRTGRLPVRASVLVSVAESAGKSVDELRQVLGERRCKARM